MRSILLKVLKKAVHHAKHFETGVQARLLVSSRCDPAYTCTLARTPASPDLATTPWRKRERNHGQGILGTYYDWKSGPRLILRITAGPQTIAAAVVDVGEGASGALNRGRPSYVAAPA